MTDVLSPLPSQNPGIPTHGHLPKSWNTLPFPSPQEMQMPRSAPSPLPACPSGPAPAAPAFPTSWPSPLSVLPSPTASPAPVGPLPVKPTVEITPVTPFVAEKTVVSNEPDFTDDDLREAFGPIVEDAVRKAVYAKENGMDTYLEPMLRATIRRALAEYSPASRPFHAPGAFDRFIWHLQALFTSRTYEDILFEKTHRFQVEEVFLVDAASLALVSFASCDPARHSSAKRIGSTVQRIALQLRDEDGKIRTAFDLPDKRNAISREGKFVTLVAVVRGQPNELVIADLEFSLRRIEDRFREQFQKEGSALLHPLQPFLEDCLLIQAPASAA
ncbi:MAG: hypothetical protein ABIT37_13705 [Luteolibacter sp.]